MTYKYPHIGLWAKYLTDIELAYLVLFSIATEAQRRSLVAVEDLEYPHLFSEMDSSTATYEFAIESENDNGEKPLISLEVWHKSWEDRNEVSYLDFAIESLEVWTPQHPEKAIEIRPSDFASGEYDFTYKDLNAIASEVVYKRAISDKVSTTVQTYHFTFSALKFSQNLEEKIDKILKRRDISTRISSKKFGL